MTDEQNDLIFHIFLKCIQTDVITKIEEMCQISYLHRIRTRNHTTWHNTSFTYRDNSL